jgi:hypothetical protein
MRHLLADDEILKAMAELSTRLEQSYLGYRIIFLGVDLERRPRKATAIYGYGRGWT